MGLDPEPLVREYLDRHARSVRPSLKSDYPAQHPPPAEPLPAMPSAELAVKRRRVDWAGLLEEAAQRLHEQAARWTVAWRRWRARRPVAPDGRRARPYRAVSSRMVLPAGLGRPAVAVAALAVLVLLVVGIALWMSRARPAVPAPTVAAVPAAGTVPLRLAEEPPATYLKIRLP
jgi:hypothetical protein